MIIGLLKQPFFIELTGMVSGTSENRCFKKKTIIKTTKFNGGLVCLFIRIIVQMVMVSEYRPILGFKILYFKENKSDLISWIIIG